MLDQYLYPSAAIHALMDRLSAHSVGYNARRTAGRLSGAMPVACNRASACDRCGGTCPIALGQPSRRSPAAPSAAVAARCRIDAEEPMFCGQIYFWTRPQKLGGPAYGGAEAITP